jgi:hypothetical protein
MAFVMHNDPAGASALSDESSNCRVKASPDAIEDTTAGPFDLKFSSQLYCSGYKNIEKSYGVLFSTLQNQMVTVLDDYRGTIAVYKNGQVVDTAAKYSAMKGLSQTDALSDQDISLDVKIRYDGLAKVMDMYIDGSVSGGWCKGVI